MSATDRTPRRRDAQRNRQAIMAAARDLFAECADVPMYELAKRAGVGQATLYRNFPDRRDLAAALLAEQIARTEALATEHADDPDAFFVLLRHVVEMMAQCRALGELTRENACSGSELAVCRERLAELLKQPLRGAKAAGTVPCAVTIEDVFLVLSMIQGAIDAAHGPAARSAAASRAFNLAMEGLAS